MKPPHRITLDVQLLSETMHLLREAVDSQMVREYLGTQWAEDTKETVDKLFSISAKSTAFKRYEKLL